MKFTISIVLHKSEDEGQKFLKLFSERKSFSFEGKFLVKDYLMTLNSSVEEGLEVSCSLIEDKRGK